jgi:ubiquilin
MGVEDGHAVHIVRVAGQAPAAAEAPTPAPATAAPPSAPVATTPAPAPAPPAPAVNPYAALFNPVAAAPPAAPLQQPPAFPPLGGGMQQWPGGFGAMPGGMPNVPPEMMQQMMQDPRARQAMQAMLSNPAMMQAVMAQHPMLQGMPAEQRNAVMQQMADPNMINLALGMMGGGGAPHPAPGPANVDAQAQQLVLMGFPDAQANTAALRASNGDIGRAVQQLQLQQIQQMFGGGGAPTAGGGGAPFAMPPNFFGAPPVGNPREVYAAQLQQLKDMGFPNESANLAALQQSQGNIDFAIERLLGA